MTASSFVGLFNQFGRAVIGKCPQKESSFAPRTVLSFTCPRSSKKGKTEHKVALTTRVRAPRARRPLSLQAKEGLGREEQCWRAGDLEQVQLFSNERGVSVGPSTQRLPVPGFSTPPPIILKCNILRIVVYRELLALGLIFINTLGTMQSDALR